MEAPPATRTVRRTVRVAFALAAGQALLVAVLGWIVLGFSAHGAPASEVAMPTLGTRPPYIPLTQVTSVPAPQRSTTDGTSPGVTATPADRVAKQPVPTGVPAITVPLPSATPAPDPTGATTSEPTADPTDDPTTIADPQVTTTASATPTPTATTSTPTATTPVPCRNAGLTGHPGTTPRCPPPVAPHWRPFPAQG